MTMAVRPTKFTNYRTLVSTQTQPDSALIVDDDELVLSAIGRMLNGKAHLTLEKDPLRARTLLESEARFAVVVSDLRMPGISGLTLLQHSRRVAPDSVRILISGAVDLTDAVMAVNDCQVFRVLVKPFQPKALTDAVLAGIEQHRLALAERVLLDETLQGSVQALAELFLLVQPAAFGRAMRLRRHVSDLARQVGVARRWDIEIAALLSQIGSVSLSAETLDRWYHGRPLSDTEQEQIRQLPSTAQALVANIPRLEPVKEILRLQDVVPSDSVPPGARMLAIARDFDLLIAQGENAEAAITIMEQRGRYDSGYLREFRALRGENAPRAAIREMKLSEVRQSMVLASDIYSPTGLLLIARGQRVTPALVERIRGPWRSFAASCAVRAVTEPE
jgi:response regulator RpfG family c-di-GMP phosphodiesterase